MSATAINFKTRVLVLTLFSLSTYFAYIKLTATFNMQFVFQGWAKKTVICSPTVQLRCTELRPTSVGGPFDVGRKPCEPLH